MVGCVPYSYFQVYDIKINDSKNNYIYENNHIKIIYNFWREYGNEDFLVLNKTDSNLYIDLSKSHLIINNNAYTYYQNKEWSLKKSKTINSGYGNSTSSNFYYTSNHYVYPLTKSVSSYNSFSETSEFGTAYKEIKIVVIPPNSQKIISGFRLNKMLYANCDINKFPKHHNNISSINFDENNSPVKYKNYLTYYFEKDNNLVLTNTFWINKILFVPYNDFYEDKYEINCGEKSMYTVQYFKYANNNRFYLEYKNNSEFVNTNNTSKESSQINNYDLKIGDKVQFKIGFNKYTGEIVEFIPPYDFKIKYKVKNGESKYVIKEHTWINKID